METFLRGERRGERKKKRGTKAPSQKKSTSGGHERAEGKTLGGKNEKIAIRRVDKNQTVNKALSREKSKLLRVGGKDRGVRKSRSIENSTTKIHEEVHSVRKILFGKARKLRAFLLSTL